MKNFKAFNSLNEDDNISTREEIAQIKPLLIDYLTAEYTEEEAEEQIKYAKIEILQAVKITYENKSVEYVLITEDGVKSFDDFK